MISELCVIVNDTCNLKCKYCYYETNIYKQSYRYINKYNLLDFIDRLCITKKIDRISFTGGEPFLYKGLCQLAIAAKKYCNSISVYTNGTLISEEDITWLKQTNAYLYISVDCPDRKYVEDHRGGYDKLIKNLDMLKSRDFNNIVFSCALTRFNVYRMDEVLKYATKQNAKLELDVIYNSPNSAYNWDAEEIHLYPIKKIFDKVFNEKNDFHWKLLNYLISGHKIKNCRHLNDRLIINCDGNIYPCFHARKFLGTCNESADVVMCRLKKFENENSICHSCKLCCFNEI
ncbi:radical SAM protein [Sporolactobacillus shoreicorticis]|uniref:Radical SAM protein n=1 Tax=Sporolactobacillus shoreicorticis TaxID=1923877 RepID=A0ABW5SAJ0_9BACL|nr:radical SAM protein [Sporolactobacillus shoreicorticis]MCO7128245.1 radical SAM protein [Sporolactobacillus shoreicorticis]